MKKQYYQLDLFKFLFAIVVISIHASPFSGNIGWYYNATIANIAVPFFFMTSGFLLFGKLKEKERAEQRQIVYKYVVHILKMYLVWTVIWIPWRILNYINTGESVSEFLIKYARNIIIGTTGDALWYLPALGFSVIIIWWLKSRWKTSTICIFGGIFYLLGALISTWYQFMPCKEMIQGYYLVFQSTDNGLFCGTLFTAIGVLLCEHKAGNLSFDIIGACVSFGLLFGEAYLSKMAAANYSDSVVLLTVPVAACFIFRLILRIQIPECELLIKARKYSTMMYLAHCFIIRTLKMMYAILKINVDAFVHFGAVLLISVAFSVIVVHLSEHSKGKFLKFLY